MNTHPMSYLSPKLEARHGPEGCGVYAVQPLQAGELVTAWGGEVFSHDEFMALPEKLRSLSVQVEEDLYLVSVKVGPADCFNHSCDPNAGMDGQIVLVALRDIAVGEQVCFDYAMTDGTPYDEFECECGSDICRKTITGEDWKQPELWERYKGHFAPYLQRRIDRLKGPG
jgi:uncharacterized protein